jgi:hypothetical protein
MLLAFCSTYPKTYIYIYICIYIYECINLSVQELFLGELFQAMISLAQD